MLDFTHSELIANHTEGEFPQDNRASIFSRTIGKLANIPHPFRSSNFANKPESESNITYLLWNEENPEPVMVSMATPEQAKPTIKDRLYDAYGRICMMATPNMLDPNDPSHEAGDTSGSPKRPKKLGALAFIGAGLTTAAGVYVASKGGVDFSSHHGALHHVNEAMNNRNPGSGHQATMPQSATYPVKPNPNHITDMNQAKPDKPPTPKTKPAFVTERLAKGSNFWVESTKELGKHASLKAINARDHLLLKLNHVTPAMAYHLKVGYHFIRPR